MDSDNSGTISLEEVQDGFRTIPEFADLMQIMDVGEEDLQCIFEILDQNGTGEVDYSDFTQQLWKMRSQEVKTMLTFLKHFIIQMRSTVDEELQNCKDPHMM